MTESVNVRDVPAGAPVGRPCFLVYDWFVKNRPQVDWPRLFALGLRQIVHVDLVQVERPNLRVIETVRKTADGPRRDVTWETDRGCLHEWYLGEWRQEYLVKSPGDYRVLARAWEDAVIRPNQAAVRAAEAAAGPGDIVLGQLGRTPFQHVQIDLAGLECFSLDIAGEEPALLDLLEQLNAVKAREFTVAADIASGQVKLWENLSIETMGPELYRRHLVPVYRTLFPLLDRTGRKLQVHYDGRLRSVIEDIAALPFDGIDSFTEPPEGDMSVAEARAAWPDKFLWIHPNLGLYELPEPQMLRNFQRLIRDAGGRRFCLMISEEIPPAWERTVPAVLERL
jgi:hypothetical protein